MVRHGQTDWNAQSRFQGQHDIPLNEIGKAQAWRNGEILRERLGDDASLFDYVSSPLGRTRETMERLRGAMGLVRADYRTDDRLKEVCFGDWEGFTASELERLHPEKMAARAAAKWDFIPPGDKAESYEILSWRIGAWLTGVERPTVCVAHGGVMRAALKLITGMPKEKACESNIPQDRLLRIDRDARQADWF